MSRIIIITILMSFEGIVFASNTPSESLIQKIAAQINLVTNADGLPLGSSVQDKKTFYTAKHIINDACNDTSDCPVYINRQKFFARQSVGDLAILQANSEVQSTPLRSRNEISQATESPIICAGFVDPIALRKPEHIAAAENIRQEILNGANKKRSILNFIILRLMYPLYSPFITFAAVDRSLRQIKDEELLSIGTSHILLQRLSADSKALLVISTGRITRVETHRLHASCEGGQGMSGGGLFTMSGELIGITSETSSPQARFLRQFANFGSLIFEGI